MARSVATLEESFDTKPIAHDVEAESIIGEAPLSKIPRQGEWTYEHWLQFPNDGWKYEIIDGVLHMSPPPAIIHQDSSGELFARMRFYGSWKLLVVFACLHSRCRYLLCEADKDRKHRHKLR